MKQTATYRILSLSRYQKITALIVADVMLALACFYVAMFLRLESNDFQFNVLVWLAFLPTVPVLVVSFHFFGLYRTMTRFITARAFQSICVGVLIASVALFLSSQVFSALVLRPGSTILVPRSVPGIFVVLLIGAAGGVRFLFRSFLLSWVSPDRQAIAIYGAGQAGRQLRYALNQGQEYHAVAFIDDNTDFHNSLIGDLRVFPPNSIPTLIDRYDIKSILLAVPSASRTRRREIIEQISSYNVDVKTIPGISDIVSGKASFSELRRVSPEDLLGRDPVEPRPDLMARNITGKVVLVSGAGGSIGSELCRQIVKFDPVTLVLLDISEFALYSIAMEIKESMASAGKHFAVEPILGSVQDSVKMTEMLKQFSVQTVFHAAAYKHVALVEENVVEGVRNNVFGTRVIAQAAADLGVENFIMVSTDKAVRPTNFMGASKRMAELVCQGLASETPNTKFSMVRFGNVLGSSGSVIPRFKAQIEQGGPVTVTHREITRFFMTIPEASQLVIQASAMAKGGDVFVLDMGEPVKILDLAQSMVRLFGLKPYVMETTDPFEPARGDIGIMIVGLNKGEKLYEELLIGNNPMGTEHPRIMTATEISLPKESLKILLDQLQEACLAGDAQEIRRIFLEAPLGFQPTDENVHDLIWMAAQRRKN